MRAPIKPIITRKYKTFYLLVLFWVGLCVHNHAIAQCPVYGTPVLQARVGPDCEGDTIKFAIGWSTDRGMYDYSLFKFQLYVNGILVNTVTGSVAQMFLTQVQPTDVVWAKIIYNDCVSNPSNQLTGLGFIPVVQPSVSITSSQSNPVCPGSAITYTAKSVYGGPSPIYSWQVNGKNVAVTDSTFTSTTLKDGDKVNCILGVINSSYCLVTRTVSSDTLTAHFISSTATAVIIDASVNNVYQGTPITFTATASNTGTNTSYQWEVNGIKVGADSTSFTSNTLKNGDQVECVVSTNVGCTILTGSNVITAIIKPPPPITAPNTFTPNGDGINDTWKISGLSFYPNILIKVFNRYGVIVYQSRGYPTPWDGTGQNKRPLPDGVYYYLIYPDDKSPEISGWIAIIR